MPLNFITYISISKGFTSGQIYPFPHDNFWLPHCVFQLDSLSKKKQSSCHTYIGWNSFPSLYLPCIPLKTGLCKIYPHSSLG